MKLRVSLIYLFSIGATIALIYVVIQRGKHLQAPTLWPNAWSLRLEPAPSDCPLFPGPELEASLNQSGEMLSFNLRTPRELGLHGKVDLSGNFEAEAKLRPGILAECAGEKMVWRGHIGREAIQGEFSLAPGNCARCRGTLSLSGTPKPR